MVPFKQPSVRENCYKTECTLNMKNYYYCVQKKGKKATLYKRNLVHTDKCAVTCNENGFRGEKVYI